MTSIADVLQDAHVAAAIECDGRRLSQGELRERSDRVSRGLSALVPSGSRVGFLDTNSEVFLELLFGAALAGVVIVPLNYRLALPELTAVVEDAALEVLFVGRQFEPVAAAILEQGARLTRVIVLDDESASGYAAWRDQTHVVRPRPDIQRSDVVLQVYTSGTLGGPKGVLLTHDSLLTGVPMLDDEYPCSPDRDVSLVCMPMYHVSGCLWALTCLYSGLSMVILRSVSAAALLDAIARHQVTILLIVPTVLGWMLAAPERDRADLSSLRMILYGGSAIPQQLLADALAALPCDFGQVYGLTESGGAITYLSPADHRSGDAARLRSCGRPLRQAAVRVVDATGADVPPGEAGEIVCRSAQNMKGYWRADSGRGLRGQDGWLRTGDVGCFDADGYLYVKDRLDDMVVSGGENIFPAEIEAALTAHPSVADAGVVGMPDPVWGARLCAFVALRSGAAATQDDLQAFLRERLATYKHPRTIRFVSGLPRNAAGKLLRRELRAAAE